MARILAVQNLIVYDYNISCPVHAVPGFGGYQFSEVGARVLELTEITPYAEYSSSDVMGIGSEIARIFEQGLTGVFDTSSWEQCRSRYIPMHEIRLVQVRLLASPPQRRGTPKLSVCNLSVC